jgi:hypothetical protein
MTGARLGVEIIVEETSRYAKTQTLQRGGQNRTESSRHDGIQQYEIFH